jgi:hypothetical protein
MTREVFPMRIDKLRKLIWAVFWLLSIFTWIVSCKLWMMHSYDLILSVLAIANLCFALWLVVLSNYSCSSILLAIIGLGFGQYWLIETVFIFIIWKLRGFAP